jgi:hypothetical protein
VRHVWGFLAFMAIWSLGWWVLGIHPTLAETFLLIVACTAADIAREVSS